MITAMLAKEATVLSSGVAQHLSSATLHIHHPQEPSRSCMRQDAVATDVAAAAAAEEEEEGEEEEKEEGEAAHLEDAGDQAFW